MSQYFLDLFVVLQSHDGGTIQSLGSVLHLQQMKLILDLRVQSRITLTLALKTWMDNNLELCNRDLCECIELGDDECFSLARNPKITLLTSRL